MIPSPIHRVLSVTRTHGVASLVMGGQACILYGAAEFSRDIDLAIVADAENLTRLSNALPPGSPPRPYQLPIEPARLTLADPLDGVVHRALPVPLRAPDARRADLHRQPPLERGIDLGAHQVVVRREAETGGSRHPAGSPNGTVHDETLISG